jgi:hypothetical protein
MVAEFLGPARPPIGPPAEGRNDTWLPVLSAMICGMIDLGSFRAATCDGSTRRSFLRMGASLPLALGMGGLGRGDADVPKHARAKSVVFVFLWGGPSHLDTFDPKPDAPADCRGPLATIGTRTPGVRFTELLPLTAARSDRFTLIRSHVQSSSGHPDGGTVALTGYEERPFPIKPNFGSIVAAHRGHRGQLPPFISLANGMLADSGRMIEGYGAGTLPRANDPFLVACSDRGEVNLPGMRLLEGLTPDKMVDRASLFQRLDGDLRRIGAPAIDRWDESYRSAFELLTNPVARQAFDLTREAPATRDRYGHTTFGQSALLTRRLVVAGVPYIQLNYSRHPEAITPNYEMGWDTHIWNYELLQDHHCPTFDRAYTALLDDLHDRGLLDQTLVVAMGEFGRTPKLNKRASRDHWTRCYFSLWAGAGLTPGRVIGASSRLGEDPVTDPVTPLMVGTTIAELAGIDAATRASMRVLVGGEPIDELL